MTHRQVPAPADHRHAPASAPAHRRAVPFDTRASRSPLFDQEGISAQNLLINKHHYDDAFRKTNIDVLVEEIRDWKNVFARRSRTFHAWYYLYRDGFGKRLTNMRVLELGCGDGRNALFMSCMGAHVTAIDISTESPRIIREVVSRTGLSAERTIGIAGDFLDIELAPQSFDFIVGIAFLHHLTHEQEAAYLGKAARLLKADGEARFSEPAVNSRALDRLRWLVPVQDRPSVLNRRAFAAWKALDPHPEHDCSSRHFIEVGRRFFRYAETQPGGCLERLERFIPHGPTNDWYQVFGRRLEQRLPAWCQRVAARTQLIVFRGPWAAVALEQDPAVC
ncbi:MAG: class I SAM-dependent methyltransferase [Candidatus Eisenbacteria bacterium]